MKDNELFIADVIRATDKDTLIALCDKAHLDWKDRGARSIEIAKRRFFFGTNGDIVKIVDYVGDTTSDNKGSRAANLTPGRRMV
jgi:hypothetical protein